MAISNQRQIKLIEQQSRIGKKFNAFLALTLLLIFIVQSHVVTACAVDPQIIGPKSLCNPNQDYTTPSQLNGSYTWTFTENNGGAVTILIGQTVSYGFGPDGGTVSLDIQSNACNGTVSQEVAPCCVETSTINLIVPDGDLLSMHPAGDFDGKIILVEGKFEIDVSPTIITNAQFIIESGGYINVTQNTNLTLIDCSFGSCTYMWRGINLADGVKLVTEGNCSFQDANKAIDASFGANFYLNHCTFANNVFGVVSNIDLPVGNEGGFTVSDCEFGFTSPLKLAYPNQIAFGTHPRAGIYLKYRNGILGDNNEEPNNFYDLNTGIILEYSSINIYNAHFERIQNEGFYPEVFMGSAIYSSDDGTATFNPLEVNGVNFILGQSNPLIIMRNCDFGVFTHNAQAIINTCLMLDMKTGIFSRGATNSKRIWAGYNYIQASELGIHFYINPGAESLIADNNKIYTSSDNAKCIVAEQGASWGNTILEISQNELIDIGLGGIEVNFFVNPLIYANSVTAVGAANPGFNGINIRNSNTPYLSCNAVEGNSQSLSNPDNNGIKIDMSPSSTLHCNAVNNTKTGIGFYGANTGGADMADNTLGNHYFGLYLNTVAAIGQQYHKGNQWTGAYASGFGAFNANNSSPLTLNLSKFIVHTLSSPVNNYYPAIPFNNNGWFLTDPTGQPYDCDVQDECHQMGADNRMASNSFALEDAIANGTFSTLDFVPESKTIAKHYLYDMLKADTTLLSQNAAWQNFYQVQKSSSLGKIEGVNDEMKQLHFYNSFFNNAKTAVTLSIAAMLENLKQLDSLRNNGGNVTSIDSSILAIKLQQQIARHAFEQILLQHDASIAGNTTITEQNNTTIITTELPEQNERAVNAIYLETVAKGNFSLTAGQVSTLLPIAQQCPYSGGAAVYNARVLLQLYNRNLLYDDNTVCWSQGIYRLSGSNILPTIYNPATNSSDFEFSLAPNPANGEVRINFTNLLPEPTNLLVSNNIGNLVLRVVLPSNISSYALSTDKLVNGIYQVKLSSPIFVDMSSKLVIIK